VWKNKVKSGGRWKDREEYKMDINKKKKNRNMRDDFSVVRTILACRVKLIPCPCDARKEVFTSKSKYA
jgi:hypothetical protein